MALLISSNRYYITRQESNIEDSEQPDGPFGQMSVGGITLRFAWSQIGAVAFDTAVEFDNPFITETNPLTPVELPPGADPPFPAVFPYFFSTGEVYGRDHLNANITMVRGDNFAFDLRVLNNGVAVDLTGGDMTMTAKWSPTDPNIDAVFTRTLGSGITFTDAAAGEVSVELIPSNTNGLPDKQIFLNYDIEYTTSLGKIYTITRGKLKVVPDITEP